MAATAKCSDHPYDSDLPGARMLLVASEWLSRNGGLSTFNRELCAALAAAGQQVVCLVPTATIEETSDAMDRGVTLIGAVPEPYTPDMVRLRRRPQLGDLAPQIIVGHGRITGPHARALREDFYPEAARVHVVHTYAGHLEWFKPPGPNESRAQKAAERESQERSLAEDANLVVAVGPLLAREATSLLGREVLEVVPGVALTEGAELPRAVPATRRCLLAGRAEDRDLKGLDIAAAAFKLLPVAEARDMPVLVIQGAPLDVADELASDLGEIAGSRLRIHVAPFTTQPQQLALELGRATLAIMPSRREGFGLAGLEAIGAGIPVLVSANSGLGELLVDLGGPAAECVVPVDDDLTTDSGRWAERITATFRDRPLAFANAAEVHQQVVERCAWPNAVDALLAALSLDRSSAAEPLQILSNGSASRGTMLSNLPARATDFHGREEQLNAINEHLESKGPRAICALLGPAGTGKTQIAVELAWRRRSRYEVIWMVRAESEVSLAADLSSLARQLGIIEDGAPPADQVAAAHEWLTGHKRWLLLIDEISDPALLEGWVEVPLTGDVIVTSRRTDWEQPVKGLTIGPWSRNESVDYLLARTGDPRPELASAVADALGDLPLAIALAAAYIDETGSGIDKYLQQLRNDAPMLFDRDEPNSSDEIVAATAGPAWQELTREPLASELLSLAAFYAGEAIPRELLLEFLELPESAQMERDLTLNDRALAAGMRLAQLSQQGDCFILHPLLAERARRELGEEAGAWAVQACTVALKALSAPLAVGTDLLPHALSATSHAISLALLSDAPAESYAVVVRVRVLSSRLLVGIGQLQSAEDALRELAGFLDNIERRDEFDPVLAVLVALERAHIATLSDKPTDAAQLCAASHKLANDSGILPVPASALGCEILFEILQAAPTMLPALSYRALETSRQVLSGYSRSDDGPRQVALQLRLLILTSVFAAGQLDDAAAIGIFSLRESSTAEGDPNGYPRKQIQELTAAALDGLGDSSSSQAVRNATV